MATKTAKTKTAEVSETQEQYRRRIMTKICALISQKQVLTQICTQSDMPCYDTIYQWMNDSDELSDMYARARSRRASARADRIDEITSQMIAGDIKPDVARVAIDAEKWQASKENAKVYGDKIEQTLQNPDGSNLDLTVNFVSASLNKSE